MGFGGCGGFPSVRGEEEVDGAIVELARAVEVRVD